MTPTIAWPGRNASWQDLNRRIIHQTADTIGVEVERRPMVVLLAPDWDSLRHSDAIFEPLRDTPVEAIYVQPTNLRPTHDSVEKLVRYVRFLLEAASLGVPVIAGRVGAFGFVLQAPGIPIFDSGLGEAESFNLSSLNRSRKKADKGSSGAAARDASIWSPENHAPLRRRRCHPARTGAKTPRCARQPASGTGGDGPARA